MPELASFIRLLGGIPATLSIGLLASGCSAAASEKTSTPTQVTSKEAKLATPSPISGTPSTAVPGAVQSTARSFVVAYAGHDARDAGDESYADAGARAAKFATGDLAAVLAQKRPGQNAPWAALRAQQARQTVSVTSVRVPDGAPAVTSSSAFVRVGYTLTTTPRSGTARSSDEQLALRLENTVGGWRVAELPWA